MREGGEEGRRGGGFYMGEDIFISSFNCCSIREHFLYVQFKSITKKLVELKIFFRGFSKF